MPISFFSGADRAPRVSKRERPPVPENSPYAVSPHGVVAALENHLGGGLQAALDERLHQLVYDWLKGAKLTRRVLSVKFLQRRDFDGALQPAGSVLQVCRDSARMRCPLPGVTDALYAHVKASRRSWRPKNVYASGIKNDRRQQVLALLGVPESDVIGERNPEWSAVADFGTALHELYEKWLTELGVSLRAEFQVRYHHPTEGVIVSGRADHEVELDGRRYILDVKTVGRRDFDEGAYGRKFDGYRAQLNVYGRTLFLTDGVERDGLVLLVCRDSGRMAEYVVRLSAAEGDALLLRGRAIMRCVAQKRLPDGEKFGWDASFNPYKSLCELQDATGWVQQALDDGHAPEILTMARVRALYGE